MRGQDQFSELPTGLVNAMQLESTEQSAEKDSEEAEMSQAENIEPEQEQEEGVENSSQDGDEELSLKIFDIDIDVNRTRFLHSVKIGFRKVWSSP